MFLCETCNSDRCFSHCCLTIQTTLSCNYNVRILHIFLKIRFF